MAERHNSTTSKKQLATSWKDFENAFKDLAPLSNAIIAAEQTGQTLLNLESELAKSKKEIVKLKTLRETQSRSHEETISNLKNIESTLVNTFEQRYTQWSLALEACKTERQAAAAKVENIMQREIDELRKANAELLSTCDQLQQDSQSLKDDLDEKLSIIDGHKKQLRMAKEEASLLKGQTGILEFSFRKISDDIKNLHRDIYDLAQRYFAINLAEGLTEDETFKKYLPIMHTLRVQIPVSNTSTSKILRAAVVEALVAATLCRKIFRVPILPRGLDPKALNEVSRWLRSSSHPDRCTLLETMLAASLQPKEEIEDIDVALETIAGFVNSLLQERGSAFLEDVKICLEVAMRLWLKLQRSGCRIIAPLSADSQSLVYGEEKDTASSGIQREADELLGPFLVTFPRIMDEGEGRSLYPGCVIWPTSKTVLDGQSEYALQMKRIQAGPRHLSSHGKRRLSTAGTNARE